MAELGRKITCEECGVKFYDLGRADVACPKCGHLAEAGNDAPKRSSRRASSRAADNAEAEEPGEIETVEGDEDVGDDDEALDIEDDEDDAEDDEEEDDDD